MKRQNLLDAYEHLHFKELEKDKVNLKPFIILQLLLKIIQLKLRLILQLTHQHIFQRYHIHFR